MYVVPTPFHLADGIAHHRTLILPADATTDDRFVEIGKLTRIEAAELVVGDSVTMRSGIAEDLAAAADEDEVGE